VVDDEAYYRDTIRDALALDGFACEVAASPAELLKAVEDPRIACVVLDVTLAAPDALGLVETLLEARPALRVIALATQSDQELVLRALPPRRLRLPRQAGPRRGALPRGATRAARRGGRVALRRAARAVVAAGRPR
jgi:DNA-binding NarL/FixJ family response regulator